MKLNFIFACVFSLHKIEALASENRPRRLSPVVVLCDSLTANCQVGKPWSMVDQCPCPGEPQHVIDLGRKMMIEMLTVPFGVVSRGVLKATKRCLALV